MEYSTPTIASMARACLTNPTLVSLSHWVHCTFSQFKSLEHIPCYLSYCPVIPRIHEPRQLCWLLIWFYVFHYVGSDMIIHRTFEAQMALVLFYSCTEDIPSRTKITCFVSVFVNIQLYRLYLAVSVNLMSASLKHFCRMLSRYFSGSSTDLNLRYWLKWSIELIPAIQSCLNTSVSLCLNMRRKQFSPVTPWANQT